MLLWVSFFIFLIKSSEGFSAPGVIPPETFIAERWYPSNLPTVMPPWKMPGADFTHFRTSRPHKPPGFEPSTTVASPTNSIPMPPGSQPTTISTTASTISGPHPPAPQKTTIALKLENHNENFNETKLSDDETMTISVTATNIEKTTTEPLESTGNETLTILLPDFEDITKVEVINETNSGVPIDDDIITDSSGEEPALMTEPAVSETTEILETTTVESTTELASTVKIEAKKSSGMVTKTTTTVKIVPTTTQVIALEETLTTTEVPKPTASSTSASKTPNKTIVEGEVTSTTTPTFEITPTMSLQTIQPNVNATTARMKSKKDCKDILFLLDSSGNVVQQYEKQKKYIEEIVKKLDAENKRRFSLITYAGRSRQKIVVPLPIEENSVKFLEKLKKTRFLRGVTATGAALTITTQYLLQKGKRVQVVVVTDGFSFDDVNNQSKALRTLDDVETYVTGRYFPIVKDVLLSIGGAEDHVFFDKNESKLLEVLRC